jgi:kynurenine formamidase
MRVADPPRREGVGYDYPPDQCIRDTVAEPRRKPRREEYTTHALFFPAWITVIEYLTNLDRIGVARCRFVALPLALDGADGSPVRAIAMVD